jgi:hypothetical protein
MKLVKPNINWTVRDSLKALYALAVKDNYTPLTPELRKYYKERYNIKADTVKGTPMAYQIRFPPDSLIFDSRMPKEVKSQQDSIQKINDAKYSLNIITAFQKTLNLILMNGFPDETMIGLSGADTRTKDRNRVVWVYEQNINALILNNNLVNFILGSTPFKNQNELSPILMQAIRDGKLIPHHIIKINPFRADINAKASNSNFYEMGRVQVLQYRLDNNIECENALFHGKGDKKFWKKEKFTDYSEAEINEKRTDIGLEKLADAYKKAFFKANPTPFIINGGSYQKELSYISSCEVLEKMIKESVIVR